jgi:hypothetical protein
MGEVDFPCCPTPQPDLVTQLVSLGIRKHFVRTEAYLFPVEAAHILLSKSSLYLLECSEDTGRGAQHAGDHNPLQQSSHKLTANSNLYLVE